MGLIIKNPLNGTSLPQGTTLNDRIGFTESISCIQESYRTLNDKVSFEDTASVTMSTGHQDLIDIVDSAPTTSIEVGLSESVGFSKEILCHIETVVPVFLKVSDTIEVIEGYAKTLVDNFQLTEAFANDIVVKKTEKVKLNDLASTHIEPTLLDNFLLSDFNKSQIEVNLSDPVVLTEDIFVNFLQARPIGRAIAIGKKLID